MPLHNRWCSAAAGLINARIRKRAPAHALTTRTHHDTHPAEEAARVAGTGQVDPSCTVPGEYRRSQHERTLSILGYGELAGPPTLGRYMMCPLITLTNVFLTKEMQAHPIIQDTSYNKF